MKRRPSSLLISRRTIFVQSGASRSIVIESLRLFRPLYSPLCPPPIPPSTRHPPLSACLPSPKRRKFVVPRPLLYVSRARSRRDAGRPRARALSQSGKACYAPGCSALRSAARSRSAEFAEGAERRTREGVAAVIRPLDQTQHRVRFQPGFSAGKRGGGMVKHTHARTHICARARGEREEETGRAKLSVSMAEVIVLFSGCCYVYAVGRRERIEESIPATRQ